MFAYPQLHLEFVSLLMDLFIKGQFLVFKAKTLTASAGGELLDTSILKNNITNYDF